MNEDIEQSKTLISKLTDPEAYLEVIKDYDGGAALIFTLKNGRLYCYHDKEKPLFHGRIKINGKYGTYISSMDESLKAIGCSKVREFSSEMVHIFENGKLISVVKVKRNPIKPEPTTYHPSTYPRHVPAHYPRDSRTFYDGFGWPGGDEDDGVSYEIIPVVKNIILKGDTVVPNEEGKLALASISSKILSAEVLEVDTINKFLKLKIKNVPFTDNVITPKVGQVYESVPMEYFVSIESEITRHINNEISNSTKEEKKEVKKEEPKKKKNNADLLIEGLSAYDAQESELRVTDFDEYREQYWAVLLNLRNKLKEAENGDWFVMTENLKEIREILEDEVFTMFCLNL